MLFNILDLDSITLIITSIYVFLYVYIDTLFQLAFLETLHG